MLKKSKSIDEYLKPLSSEKRAALQELRKAIKALVPRAEECISYSIPAFRLDGKLLVAFAAAANHCSFFPMSSTTIKKHKDEVESYQTSKGTIRFSSDKPLPLSLVRKIVKARIAENKAKYGS